VTGWLYWLLFAIVVPVVLVGIPKAIWWIEDRANEVDRRTWREMGGGRW